jgi:hypothetical protein
MDTNLMGSLHPFTSIHCNVSSRADIPARRTNAASSSMYGKGAPSLLFLSRTPIDSVAAFSFSYSKRAQI